MPITEAPPVPLGRRLTAVLDTDVHPATGEPVRADTACGVCAHWTARDTQAGPRTSCGLISRSRAHGPNLPPHTPACEKFAPAEETR